VVVEVLGEASIEREVFLVLERSPAANADTLVHPVISQSPAEATYVIID
jgi:hypothetical protein